jgi:rhodanese-related sulfurtransferase/DNA-binding transcriptional ArsR family regulator
VLGQRTNQHWNSLKRETIATDDYGARNCRHLYRAAADPGLGAVALSSWLKARALWMRRPRAWAFSVANNLQHLQHLRRAGLIAAQRDGKRAVYRLADDAETGIVSLLGAIRHVAEHATVAMERVIHSSFRARDELEPVVANELAARLREGSVVLLDVRPSDEYSLGYLPGTLNVPLRELEQRLSELPSEHEIVTYCRGPYCILSFEAVAALRARGFRVRRFEAGFPEWKAAGLPIEMAA